MLRFVKETPNKNWSLQLFNEQGVERIKTGYTGETWGVWRDIPLQDVPNRVLEGKLKIADFGRGRSAVTYELADTEGFTYKAGGKSIMLLLASLLAGVTTIEDGYFVGQWTFAKQGSEIYIIPVDPKTGKPFKLPEAG